MSHEPALSVRDLHTSYGRVQALRGLSFEPYPGEVLGHELEDLRVLTFQFRRLVRVQGPWLIVLTAYKVLNIYLFEIYGKKSSIAMVYQRLPEVWKNLFGQYFIAVNSLEGWLATQYFAFLPVLLATGSAISAAALFSKSTEDTTIHNLLVQPVSRIAVFAGMAAVPLAGVAAFFALNLPLTLGTAQLAGLLEAGAGALFQRKDFAA